MKLDSFKLIKYSLIIVYVWFGLLKLLGVSPVANLVVNTYPSLPEPLFLNFLGIWEIVIGALLLSNKTIKIGILLMWLQLGGIFMGVVLNPSLYFSGPNILYLDANGEFVVKNLVLLAASYYLWEKTK